MATRAEERTSVAGRVSRDLENEIAEAWKAVDAGSSQPIPARYRIPHMSFQLVDRAPSESTLRGLADLASRWFPIPIRLGGLGVFREPRTVLYITIVRSPRLEAFQRDVTLQLAEAGHRPAPLYLPESWVPHISIAFDTPGLEGWKRLLDREREGAFHRRSTIESLLVMSASGEQPLVLEAPLGTREGRRWPGR